MATNLTSYSNDYQAEINRRKAINPNDPTISQLTSLREAKIDAMYDNLPTVYGATNPNGTLKDINPNTNGSNRPLPFTDMPIITPPKVGGETDLTRTINQLKQAQIKANMAALDRSLGNQITNIDNQYAGIDSNAYAARNVAAGESDVAAMNFAQRAAARGIQGNAASMPEIYRNSALQSRLGDIDSGVLANKNILDSQKTQLRNAYESDRVGIQSGAEAQAIQNLIAQQNANRQFALSEAGVTGNYGGTQTMQGQAQMLSNQMAQLNIAAQEIENSYLPQTLKDEAEQLKQQVESGRINIATALAQLNQIGKGGYQASPYENAPPSGSIDMARINPVIDQVGKFMISNNTSMAATTIIAKYQNGSLTKAEANYILNQFGLSTIS